MANHSLQEILLTHLDDVKTQRKFTLTQHKALQQLCKCRTAALGGHVQRCEHGHVAGVWYILVIIEPARNVKDLPVSVG